MHFHALWISWHCSRTHAKIWRWSVGVLGGVDGGGWVSVWRREGGRWVGVAVRLVCCLWCVDVLLCILTKCFSELVCFAFSSRLFSLLLSPARWVLPASLLVSLASSRFLSVWFALHRRAEVFGQVSWSVFPHCGNVFLQSKKVRWSFALFLDFHFCAFLFGCAFLFACAFFGLVCCAPHSIGFLSGLSVRTPTSWEFFAKLIIDLAGLGRKY